VFDLYTYSTKFEVKMSDDWVYIGSYKNHSQYYRKSSVTIDEGKNIINVLVKIITKKKSSVYLKYPYNTKEPKYIKYNQQLKWYLLNYENWKYTITRITDYSKFGNVLLDTKYQPIWLHNIFSVKWDDIMADSLVEILLNKVIQDYNIWNSLSVDIKNNNVYKWPSKLSNAMIILNSLIGSVTRSFTSSFKS
jgi:hypothetical protein